MRFIVASMPHSFAALRQLRCHEMCDCSEQIVKNAMGFGIRIVQTRYAWTGKPLMCLADVGGLRVAEKSK